MSGNVVLGAAPRSAGRWVHQWLGREVVRLSADGWFVSLMVANSEVRHYGHVCLDIEPCQER